MQQLLSELHELAVRLQQQCGARELANIIHSCSKLSSPDTAKLLLPVFLQTSTLQHAKPQEVSNVVWAAATLQLQLTAVQLQQLLGSFAAVLADAKPQGVSNTLWAVATMGLQVPPELLQQLLGRFVAVLADANPQAVPNTLWAVAGMGQQVLPKQLQQLLGRFAAVLADAQPQAVSNTLWGVATMGQQVPAQQLQQLLGKFAAVLADAKPQEVSNILWAVADMGQPLPQQLPMMLAAFAKLLLDAKPQAVSNIMWACGKMQYVPLPLLQSLQQQQQQRQLLQQLLTAAKPQELANMAWACGQLGHKGQLLPGALLQQAVRQDGGTGSFTLQELCNLCWSAAVLDLQQCVHHVRQLAAAASKLFSITSDEELQQLQQVHLWLLDSQLPAPGQGLSGVLTQQQLEQCRASWEQQLTATSMRQLSYLQQSVFDAVLQLPPNTWQQQPQSEQPTADKACLIDVAAVTTSGVKVAIEVEGPQHYVQPDNTLTGPTLFRNRALAARGYAVISIPYWEWDELHSKAQQQQYLLAKLQAVKKQPDVTAALMPPPAAQQQPILAAAAVQQQQPDVAVAPQPPAVTGAGAVAPGAAEGNSHPRRRRRPRRVDPGNPQGS